MKTNELIKQLQEADPKNECEVCINNHPVNYVDKMEYYWDGRLEQVTRDNHGTPVRGGYPAGGLKLKIHYDTLEDALSDNPDMELDLSGITYQGNVQERYMDCINEWIKDGKEFQEWKKKSDEAHAAGKPPIPILSKKEAYKFRFTNWLRKLKIII